MKVQAMLSWVTLVGALGVVGCGSDDDGDKGSAPSIDSLSYSPETITMGQQATISGTLSFSDPDGDLSGIAYAITTPSGQSQTAPQSPLQGTAGHTAGVLQFAFALIPPEAGQYPFEIWVSDAAGHASNHLSGTLTAQ